MTAVNTSSSATTVTTAAKHLAAAARPSVGASFRLERQIAHGPADMVSARAKNGCHDCYRAGPCGRAACCHADSAINLAAMI